MSISASYPNIRPTLLLDFANSGRMDPRVTFSRASTATYFDETGVLQSAAIDAPRFDYDPATLAARGLLIEESRTNGTIWSESFRTRTLTVTITGGTFTNGETVTATGGGTGTYIAADSTPTSFAIFNGSGTFSGTLTGGTSGATATISASTAAWSLGGATVTANSTIAPDGATTADTLIEDTSTGSHRVFRTTSGTTNTNPYTYSFFAKANTRTRIYLGILEGTSFVRQGNAVFDLSAGTVVSAGGGSGGASGGSATIQNVGNGWYRCSYTLTLGGTDTAIFNDLALVATGTTINYTGDGTSGVYIWGAQLEAGAFPTSYIPTTTTALTRAADVASVNTLSPWYNATEGTLFAEAQTFSTSGTALLVSIDDTTSSNRIQLRRSFTSIGSGYRMVSSGGSIDITQISGTLAGVNKLSIAATAGAQTASTNGSTVTGIVSITPMPTVTRLALGDGPGSTPLNGWLRRVTFYPRVLSQSEQNAITA